MFINLLFTIPVSISHCPQIDERTHSPWHRDFLAKSNKKTPLSAFLCYVFKAARSRRVECYCNSATNSYRRFLIICPLLFIFVGKFASSNPCSIRENAAKLTLNLCLRIDNAITKTQGLVHCITAATTQRLLAHVCAIKTSSSNVGLQALF